MMILYKPAATDALFKLAHRDIVSLLNPAAFKSIIKSVISQLLHIVSVKLAGREQEEVLARISMS